MDFWLPVRAQSSEAGSVLAPSREPSRALARVQSSSTFTLHFYQESSVISFMEPFKYNPLPFTLARDFNRQFVKNLWSIRELSIKVVQWYKLHLAGAKCERTSNFGSLSRRNSGISRAKLLPSLRFTQVWQCPQKRNISVGMAVITVITNINISGFISIDE